jgi:hypothetical protein
MAQPGSRVREQALQYLDAQSDPRSVGYYNLLTNEQMAHNPQKRMQMLYEAMRNIPEVEQKEKAYEIARRVIGNDPGRQFSLAVGIYQQVPALQEQALRQMIAIDALKAEPILRDLARKPTHRLAPVAREGVAEIEGLVRHKQLEVRLEHGTWPDRAGAIREMGERHEQRGIEPLLRRYAKGQPGEQALVMDTLAKWNWQLVKAEIHRLQRLDPRWIPIFKPIMDARPGVA